MHASAGRGHPGGAPCRRGPPPPAVLFPLEVGVACKSLSSVSYSFWGLLLRALFFSAGRRSSLLRCRTPAATVSSESSSNSSSSKRGSSNSSSSSSSSSNSGSISSNSGSSSKSSSSSSTRTTGGFPPLPPLSLKGVKDWWGGAPKEGPLLRGPTLLSRRGPPSPSGLPGADVLQQRHPPYLAFETGSSSSSRSSSRIASSAAAAAGLAAAAHPVPLHAAAATAAAAAAAKAAAAAAAAGSSRFFSTRNIRGRLFYKRRPLQVPRLKPPNIRRYSSSSSSSSSRAAATGLTGLSVSVALSAASGLRELPTKRGFA
ncbi:hypothetical protein Efla_004953 [Eimeria flavescens]